MAAVIVCPGAHGLEVTVRLGMGLGDAVGDRLNRRGAGSEDLSALGIAVSVAAGAACRQSQRRGD